MAVAAFRVSNMEWGKDLYDKNTQYRGPNIYKDNKPIDIWFMFNIKLTTW
jgi:hypothetical protein